jgi:Putative adhesin
MISRSTLIGALVVVELAIVGAAFRALGAGAPAHPRHPFGFGHGGFGAASAATTKLDRTFGTGPAPHVVVDAGEVAVSLEAVPGASVRAVESLRTAGFVGGGVRPILAEQTPDGVRISAPANGEVHFMMGELDRSLRITLPPGATVEVQSAARVEARGLRGRLVAHATDGSLHVSDHQGDLELSTSDGRIELTDVRAGSVRARTGDGRLTLRRVAADHLEARTGVGRLDAADVRLSDGALATGSGRIRLGFSPDSDATVTVHSGEGRIDVPSGIAATVTESGEEVHERVLRLGSGRGSVRVSSGDGSISITQGAQV